MKIVNYHYIGGYYGATTEREMMKEIYLNGPIAVSFEIYNEFPYYSSGIYRRTVKESVCTSILSYHLS